MLNESSSISNRLRYILSPHFLPYLSLVRGAFMEFEFTRNTLMGEYYVKCSMGHEIVGRWLQEEIGKWNQFMLTFLFLFSQAEEG